MVEIVVGANLVSDAVGLHVVDLGARQLVRVLNRTLADLLVANGVVDRVIDSVVFVVLGLLEVFVTLVSVLVSL